MNAQQFRFFHTYEGEKIGHFCVELQLSTLSFGRVVTISNNLYIVQNS